MRLQIWARRGIRNCKKSAFSILKPMILEFTWGFPRKAFEIFDKVGLIVVVMLQRQLG